MTSPADYHARFMAINRLADAGDLTGAAALSRAVAEQAAHHQASAWVRFFEGEALCLGGQLGAGLKLVRQACRELPEVGFVQTNCGIILSLQGRVKQALSVLNRALQLEPDNLEALNQRNICLVKLGRLREALAGFDQVLQRHPEQPHALRNKGVTLARLGREQEALQLLDQALRFDPDDRHAQSEKHILQEEMQLRGTPLGWLLLWLRRRLVPTLRRLRYQFG